jgi:hypothetical protein
MVSLEAKLAAIVEAMNSSEKKLFAQKSKDMRGNVEATLNVAESILGADLAARRTENIRESSTRIRRNNGGTREVQESRDVFAETDAVLFEGMAKCRPQSSKGLTELVESNGQFVPVIEASTGAARLTESQRQDYEFALAIGLSESDALKVALSNFIKG